MDEIEKSKKIGEYAEKHPKKFKNFLEKNNEFLKNNNKINFREFTDEQGYVDLDKIQYITLMGKGGIHGAYFAQKWIIAPDLTEILVKKTTDYDINLDNISPEQQLFEKTCRYNSVYLPEILKQINIETADYYFAKEDNKQYIMTPSVLEKNERIISGDEILKNANDADEKYVSIEVKAIDKYLRDVIHDKDEKHIENIKNDFINKMIMSKFLNVEDFHAGDWGIIYNDKTHITRSLPMIDIDCSIDSIESINMVNLSNKKTNSFEDLVKQYGNKESVKQLINKLKYIDVHDAIDNVYEKKGILIPREVQNNYKMYFSKMKNRTEILQEEINNNIGIEK